MSEVIIKLKIKHSDSDNGCIASIIWENEAGEVLLEASGKTTIDALRNFINRLEYNKETYLDIPDNHMNEIGKIRKKEILNLFNKNSWELFKLLR